MTNTKLTPSLITGYINNQTHLSSPEPSRDLTVHIYFLCNSQLTKTALIEDDVTWILNRKQPLAMWFA